MYTRDLCTISISAFQPPPSSSVMVPAASAGLEQYLPSSAVPHKYAHHLPLRQQHRISRPQKKFYPLSDFPRSSVEAAPCRCHRLLSEGPLAEQWEESVLYRL